MIKETTSGHLSSFRKSHTQNLVKWTILACSKCTKKKKIKVILSQRYLDYVPWMQSHAELGWFPRIIIKLGAIARRSGPDTQPKLCAS